MRAIGLIHNTTADTWHPVIFRDGPLPGSSPTLDRVKSQCHHTTGFPTREAAIAEMASMKVRCAENGYGDPFIDESYVVKWDGEGVPAITAFVTDGRLL